MKVFLGVLVVALFCGLCYGDFIITREANLEAFVKMNDDGSNPQTLVTTRGFSDGNMALNGQRFYYKLDGPDDFQVVNISAPLPNTKKLAEFNPYEPKCVVSLGKKLYFFMFNGSLYSANLKAGKPVRLTTGLPTCGGPGAVISGKKIFYLKDDRVITIEAKKGAAPTNLLTETDIDPLCATKSCALEVISLQGKKLWLRSRVNGVPKVVTCSLTGTDIQVAFTIPFTVSQYDEGFGVLSNNDVILYRNGQIVKLTAASGYTTIVNLTNAVTQKFHHKILVGGGSAVTSLATPSNVQLVKSFILSWNPVAGATAYTVLYTLEGSGNTLTATTNTNSIAVTNGVTSGTWNVKVVATLGNTSSSPSATFTVVVA